MFYRFDFLELILMILNTIILEFCVFLPENFYVFFLCFSGKGGDRYPYYSEKGDFFYFLSFQKILVLVLLKMILRANIG